jgi:hypothetical protein
MSDKTPHNRRRILFRPHVSFTEKLDFKDLENIPYKSCTLEFEEIINKEHKQF